MQKCFLDEPDKLFLLTRFIRRTLTLAFLHWSHEAAALVVRLFRAGRCSVEPVSCLLRNSGVRVQVAFAHLVMLLLLFRVARRLLQRLMLPFFTPLPGHEYGHL